MGQLRTGSRASFNGVRYLLETDPGKLTYRTATQTDLTPKAYTDIKIADATTGAVTFGLPTGYFTGIGYVDANVVRDSADPRVATFCMIRNWSTSSVTVQCFESKTTPILLGGTIEGLEIATGSFYVTLFVIGN